MHLTAPLLRQSIHFPRLYSTKFYKSNLKRLLLEMPKDNKHIADIQKQRQKIKERNTKYIPGTVNLQILGSGAPGSPASVYLFSDQSSYLFNCGEGTQRLAHEHKRKLSRLEQIFMTRTSWTRIGGLPGLSLTVQDAGVPKITLHGPPGLNTIYQAMRRFVVLKDLTVDANVCDTPGPVYEDSVMIVQYVPLFKKCETTEPTNDSTEDQADSIFDDTNYYPHETPSQPPKEENIQDINSQRESLVMAYICKIKPRPGTLCLEKCVDKGVPPGPLLGQLKNGQNVKLPNGEIVYAADVRGPDDPGPVFILLDIPSNDYMDSFLQSQSVFSKHQATAACDQDVANLVIHFTPPEVMNMKIYRSFMNDFSPSTRHLVLNETNLCSGYIAAHRIQYQLNQVDQNIFPILHEYSNTNSSTNSSEPASKKPKLATENGHENASYSIELGASSLTCYHLRPNKGLDRSIEAILNPTEYLNELSLIPGFVDSLAELKQQIQHVKRENIDRSTEYPRIVFLGTGSCIPNKTRNVSSILIHTTKDSCILLDCGEGTCGQLFRFYGIENMQSIFKKLKAIYISHLHADHHIGLIGICQERRKILGSTAEPLILFAPKQISSWMHFYNKQIELIEREYKLVHNGNMVTEPLTDSTALEMGIKTIRTCPVRHCPHSFGLSIELVSGQKVTYSGDTMSCNELVTIGQDSTILIHEATMEDELIDQAKIKMHSTVSQAIEQGAKMNAKYTLLTHFSQRYAKLPRLANSLPSNVGIAFDNMEVTESDLENLHLLYPTLKLLFSEHCEEMEQKALKRAFKQQRAEDRRKSEVEAVVI